MLYKEKNMLNVLYVNLNYNKPDEYGTLQVQELHITENIFNFLFYYKQCKDLGKISFFFF